jgi:hypothetical protein
MLQAQFTIHLVLHAVFPQIIKWRGSNVPECVTSYILAGLQVWITFAELSSFSSFYKLCEWYKAAEL